MSYFIHVFCKDAKPVQSAELTEFIDEGSYFDDEPTFVRVPDAAPEEEWKELQIYYQEGKRPVVVWQHNDKVLREQLSEMEADELSMVDGSRQVIAFEIDRLGLTEEGWHMVDCLEAYVARTRDGVVYAPDDGFYDKDLNKL